VLIIFIIIYKDKRIINRMMNGIIREIDNVTWVNKDEQQQIVNN